jgi:hypothetical protein
MTVVTVDSDTSQDLKPEYGITTPGTFVRMDANSKEVTKFTGALPDKSSNPTSTS